MWETMGKTVLASHEDARIGSHGKNEKIRSGGQVVVSKGKLQSRMMSSEADLIDDFP